MKGAYINAILLDSLLPIARSFTKIGYTVADIFDVMLNGPRQAEEIHQLRIKNQMLEAERVFSDSIKKENEELRAVLRRKKEGSQLVYARVAGYSSSRMDDFLMIDVGEREGIQNGMPVLVAEGIIQIGTIAEVASHTSIVRLLSHVGEKTSVSLPESGVSSVATGQGGGVLEIQVPASISVREGEPLFSIGPPDYMLGYVEQIEKSDAGPFQIARLSHPVTLMDIRRVYIAVGISYE